MKVSLSVLDRMVLMGTLPAEDNMITLRMIRKVKEQVGFTEDELKVLEFKTDGDRTTWQNKVEPREFEFGEKAVEMIVGCLKKLSEKNKMTNQHLDLYDKIAGDTV
jgi:hypothetical protein